MKDWNKDCRPKHLDTHLALMDEVLDLGDLHLQFKLNEDMIDDELINIEKGLNFKYLKWGIGAGIQTATKERAEKPEFLVVPDLIPVLQEKKF